MPTEKFDSLEIGVIQREEQIKDAVQAEISKIEEIVFEIKDKLLLHSNSLNPQEIKMWEQDLATRELYLAKLKYGLAFDINDKEMIDPSFYPHGLN